MSDPYTQVNISDNTFERIFDLSVDNEELVWHRDRKTRFVKVLEGVGWKFQFDNELPKEIGPGSTIHINKKCYHEVFISSRSNYMIHMVLVWVKRSLPKARN